MRIEKKVSVTLIFGVLAICFVSGCFLLDGGMNTVDPPSLSSWPDENQESILKDLSPIRPRDTMIAERQDDRRSD